MYSPFISVSYRDVHALDSNRSHSRDQGTFNDGVSTTS